MCLCFRGGDAGDEPLCLDLGEEGDIEPRRFARCGVGGEPPLRFTLGGDDGEDPLCLGWGGDGEDPLCLIRGGDGGD